MQQQNWWDEAPVVGQPQAQPLAAQGRDDDWWHAAPVVGQPQAQQQAAPQVQRPPAQQGYGGGDYDPMSGQTFPDDGIPVNPDLTAQMAQAPGFGASQEVPIDLSTKLSPDQVGALKQGAWVRATNGNVYQLPGDAFFENPGASDVPQGGGLYVRQPRLQDSVAGAATAFSEQVPGGDEAVAHLTAMLTGRKFDAVREQQMLNRDLLNQTNRGSRIAGGIAGAVGPAMLLPGAGWVNGAQGIGKVGRAAALGTGYGALYGGANTDGSAGERTKGALVGSGAGFFTGGALQGLGNALSRSGANAAANPSAQRQLSAMGVDLTPGQMAGGSLARIEDGLTSVPVFGDAIRDAQRRGLESMNRAAYNDALSPIKTSLPRATASGRDGYAAAEDAVGAAYERALQNVTVDPKQGFEPAVQALRNRPIPGAIQDTVTAVVDDFAARFAQPLPGPEFKQLDSEIAAAVRSAQAGSATDPSKRLVADRLSDLRAGMDAALDAADPFAAADKRAADAAFARLVRLRDAQQGLGTSARDGIFTAGDLNRAVRGGDSSAGNRQFARGDALGQKLSEAASQVLPSKVPDSGTPFRSIVNLPTLGGGAAAMAFVDPALLAATTTGVGLGTAAYSRPVQGALNAAYRAHAPGSVRQGAGGLFGGAAPRSAALEQGVLQWLLNRPRDDQALLRGR